MCNIAKRGRKVFLLLLLITQSYCWTSQWQFSSIITRRTLYTSGKIFYPPSNEITGIELSILKNSLGLRGLLSVKCQEIPLYTGDWALVTIEIENENINLLQKRLTGGQQLLLEEKTTNMIIEALLKEKTIKIYLNGYEELIKPENFAGCWTSLMQLPICRQMN